HERVLRAHDDDRQIGPDLLDARQKIEGVLVRHHHVGDDEVTVALAHPSPQGRGVAGGAYFVSGSRQGLIEHGADRGIVVGNQDASRGHCQPLQAVLCGVLPPLANFGINKRKMVRRDCDSHSTTPPWSPTILATSARPRPLPVGLVVTKGSNRFGSRSSGTPGPLSLTQNSSGSDTRDFLPGTDRRTPGRNAGVSWISASLPRSTTASTAF